MTKQETNSKDVKSCIHFKACWRMCRMEEYLLKQCSEKCPYYVNKSAMKLIPEEDVDEMINEITDYIMSGVDSVRDGCDPYDVYCSYDLVNYMPKGKSLDEIIEDQYEAEL